MNFTKYYKKEVKNMARLNIVLYEPEIPANTGNIGRTCVATGTRLHLIEPLGFRLGEKELKRAGMDYWKDLDVTTYVNYEEFLEKNPGQKFTWPRQKVPVRIRKLLMKKTATLCSEKKAPESPKKFCWKTRRQPSVSL